MSETPSQEMPKDARQKRLEEIKQELEAINQEIQKLHRRAQVLERGVKLTPYVGPSLNELIDKQQRLLEKKGRLFGNKE